MKKYVQYGCGLSAPEEWINFDSSPTLRIQKNPVINVLVRKNVIFPRNIKYGDIIKGLPGIEQNSCDGVYCSHVLEHLSLKDCRTAIRNSFDILKPGGIFRCILPSLEIAVQHYLENLKTTPGTASITFMDETLLGLRERNRSLKGAITNVLGNSHHLWMWDQYSLLEELKKAGFTSVRNCSFNDSKDTMFYKVEEQSRFINAIALEAIK